MTVTHVFAGMRVGDYPSARAWYERLLGRAPAMLPTDVEAVWQLTDGGWLYIVAAGGGDAAGGAVVTLLVDDLEACVAEISARGIGCDHREQVGGGTGRKATFVDPDGNIVVFAQPRV